MKRLYVFLVTQLISWICRYTLTRGRAVQYTHGGRLYMTRYALSGWLTGDSVTGFWAKLRLRLPNLYLHQMHASDLDPSLHDHPWPWALSWVMLGGYDEERFTCRQENDLARYWGPVANKQGYENSKAQRRLKAPALNVLSGSTFHRIAELLHTEDKIPGTGTWTLFLAGPRSGKKPWGYIVEGRGYVPHQERHAEIEGKEVRLNTNLDMWVADFVYRRRFRPARGKALDALGAVVGLERLRRCRWFGLLSESDKDFRTRIRDCVFDVTGAP